MTRVLQDGCPPGIRRRFIETTSTWLEAVLQETQNRIQDKATTVEGHIALRRLVGNVPMALRIGEWGLGLSLPDEVFKSPEVMRLEDCVNEVVVISNVSSPHA